MVNKITRRGFVERIGLGISMTASLPCVASQLGTDFQNYAGKKLNVAFVG